MKFLKVVLRFIITLILLHSPLALSTNLTNKDCKNIAVKINNLISGLKVDNATTGMGVVCLPGPVMVYYYSVDLTILGIVKSQFAMVLSEIKKKSINYWCSQPKNRELIFKLKSVKYHYIKTNGEYIGEIEIYKHNCN